MIKLSACFIFGMASIVVLYFLSPRINSRENGFIRLFPPHRLDYIHDRKLDADGNYLAGWSNSGFYLGNSQNPDKSIYVDSSLSHLSVQSLKIKKDRSRYAFYLRTHVDSPFAMIYEGITPILWSGRLDDSVMTQKSIDTSHFLNALPVSNSSWILKTYDPKLSQVILIKKDYASNYQYNNRYILDKSAEGIFSTDGTLEFDPESKHLFYIYSYKNKFVCLDSNLKSIYIGKTIDTIRHPVIQILADENRKMTSVAGSSILVNKMAAVSHNCLFVRSNLLANNENKSIFDRTSVIDIYDDRTGNYQYSFYIPDFQEEKMMSFQVRKDRLIALYDHYVVLYRLNYLTE